MVETYEQYAKNNILTWIEKGQQLVFPNRFDKWVKHVQMSATSIYYGKDIEDALEIMEALDKDIPMDKIKELFEKQDQASRNYIRQTVFEFSEKGPEFYEETATEEFTDEEKLIIESKKRENIRLKIAYANEPGLKRHIK